MSLSATFDTHAFVKKLTGSGFAEPQAEALSDAIKEAQDAHLDELATKRDIKELETATKNDLKNELKEFELRIIKWIFAVSAAQATLIIGLLKLL